MISLYKKGDLSIRESTRSMRRSRMRRKQEIIDSSGQGDDEDNNFDNKDEK